MIICSHNLDAHVQATLVDDKYLLCVKVWCRLCRTDFEMTDNVKISLDERQILIEMKPATGTIFAISSEVH